MSLEYIRLNPEELFYSKKELLQMELDFLLMIKKFEELRKVRKEKIAIKKELERKLPQIQKAIMILEQEFPKIPKHEQSQTLEQKEMHGLDQEIDEVRHKLIALQAAIAE